MKASSPNLPKVVAIISPHSSNFDALYAFLAMLGVGMPVTVLGKANLFKIPFSVGFKWIGIILVQRDSPHGLTQQVLNILQAHAKIWIVLAPKGTRKNAEKLKNGFFSYCPKCTDSKYGIRI